MQQNSKDRRLLFTLYKSLGRLEAWVVLITLHLAAACVPKSASDAQGNVIIGDAGNPPAIVFMIGDGMGLTQMSAALYSSPAPLNLESFTHVGFHKSYSAVDFITDSAAGATAFACGVKSYNNAIGVDADTLPCTTILEYAMRRGMATGLVATSSIVHATPASFAAHDPLRVNYEAIAEDMSTAGVDLLIGGGKRYFDRRANDDRDLLAEMQANGYQIADYFNGELDRIKLDINRKFFYLSADNQPLPVNQGRSYLAYASWLACDFLQRRSPDKGFFLMIEGSQIDWANHANEGRLAIMEVLDFDRAIGEAKRFVDMRPNTLLVVTADHESGGMAIQPDSRKGNIKTAFTTNAHTGTMVPVYAYGAGAEAFSGIYENTAIFTKMMHFLQLEAVSLNNQNR